MPLSGSRLNTALAADLLSQMQSKFPIDSSLLPAEKTALAAAQKDHCDAQAAAIGPDVVTEITGNGVVTVTGVTTGGGTSGPGTIT